MAFVPEKDDRGCLSLSSFQLLPVRTADIKCVSVCQRMPVSFFMTARAVVSCLGQILVTAVFIVRLAP